MTTQYIVDSKDTHGYVVWKVNDMNGAKARIVTFHIGYEDSDQMPGIVRARAEAFAAELNRRWVEKTQWGI